MQTDTRRSDPSRSIRPTGSMRRVAAISRTRTLRLGMPVATGTVLSTQGWSHHGDSCHFHYTCTDPDTACEGNSLGYSEITQACTADGEYDWTRQPAVSWQYNPDCGGRPGCDAVVPCGDGNRTVTCARGITGEMTGRVDEYLTADECDHPDVGFWALVMGAGPMAQAEGSRRRRPLRRRPRPPRSTRRPVSSPGARCSALSWVARPGSDFSGTRRTKRQARASSTRAGMKGRSGMQKTALLAIPPTLPRSTWCRQVVGHTTRVTAPTGIIGLSTKANRPGASAVIRGAMGAADPSSGMTRCLASLCPTPRQGRVYR